MGLNRIPCMNRPCRGALQRSYSLPEAPQSSPKLTLAPHLGRVFVQLHSYWPRYRWFSGLLMGRSIAPRLSDLVRNAWTRLCEMVTPPSCLRAHERQPFAF